MVVSTQGKRDEAGLEAELATGAEFITFIASKRKADIAEKNKKAEIDQKNAEASASNCSDARGALKDLETGRPIVRTSETGAREYIDDEGRQAEMAKARKAIADSCKG